jgi:hypothetical protein
MRAKYSLGKSVGSANLDGNNGEDGTCCRSWANCCRQSGYAGYSMRREECWRHVDMVCLVGFLFMAVNKLARLADPGQVLDDDLQSISNVISTDKLDYLLGIYVFQGNTKVHFQGSFS